MSDSKSYLQLRGLKALVTGGTKGIGQALVKALVDQGVKVLVTARSLPEQHIVEPHMFVSADASTPSGCHLIVLMVITHVINIDGMFDKWNFTVETANTIKNIQLDYTALNQQVKKLFWIDQLRR